MTMNGFSDLFRGMWTGMVWISIGTGIVCMVSYERIEKLGQKGVEEGEWRQ